MCQECHRMLCPDSCPGYSGFRPGMGRYVLRCSVCEDPIFGDEDYFSIGTRPICRGCLDEADRSELMNLCGIPSNNALYRTLGLIHRNFPRKDSQDT